MNVCMHACMYIHGNVQQIYALIYLHAVYFWCLGKAILYELCFSHSDIVKQNCTIFCVFLRARHQ